MTYNFQAKAKMAAMTGAEIAVVGGSMLLSQKFLDFKVLFKNQIAADPTYADKWFIKHQGAIKFAVGVIAAVHIKNPWLRLLAFGVAANGLVQEVRVLAVKDGQPMFDAIGNTMDDKLRQLAERISGVTNAYQSMVAGVTNNYPSQVARPIDLMNYNYSAVGNTSMMRGAMGVAMMRSAA